MSKSSNASAWPILLQLNEFPPHMRKQELILAGIWVDTVHPNMNTLLLPTMNELYDLYEQGIMWKNSINNSVINSKFITLLCITDSVARPAVLNMTLFNGKYGCTYCYEKGQHVPGKGVRRMYPYRKRIHCRTDAEMRRHMDEAYKSNEKKFGIKGLSALLILPNFDLHKGTDIDSMHNVYLGVVKLHTSLLLHGKASDCWYAGNPTQLSSINSRLLKIRPPSRISRKPRDVESMKHWKASEWRNWILYYAIPCLEDIIRPCDLKHLSLLSRATFILNKDSIDAGQLQEAELLLKQYVKNFEEIFGVINMKFNIHLLNHLVETVKNWGPFWAHSAFPFEAWNKKVVEKVTSANSKPLQITTRYLMIRFIHDLINDPSIPETTSRKIRAILNKGPQGRVVLNVTSDQSGTFKVVIVR